MELINNQWVIGIGTSIISGLLVFFFTRRFFTEKQKREYEQKIKTANNEILYAIRPLIVEKTKPSSGILKSVLVSTSRKYGVELTDIYNQETLCDDLTNEIMSNSFLSSEQKLELAKMINEFKMEREIISKEKLITVFRESSKTNTSTFMALTLSIMTAMFALVFTIFKSFKNGEEILNTTEKFPEFLSILIIALVVPLFAVMTSTLLKYFKDIEKNKRIFLTDNKTEKKEEKSPPNKS